MCTENGVGWQAGGDGQERGSSGAFPRAPARGAGQPPEPPSGRLPGTAAAEPVPPSTAPRSAALGATRPRRRRGRGRVQHGGTNPNPLPASSRPLTGSSAAGMPGGSSAPPGMMPGGRSSSPPSATHQPSPLRCLLGVPVPRLTAG